MSCTDNFRFFTFFAPPRPRPRPLPPVGDTSYASYSKAAGAPSSTGGPPFPTASLFNGSSAPSPASSTGRPPSVASSPVGSSGTFSGSGRSQKDLIVLAPCGAGEVLPMNADLPADMFTSCLTTPMPIALRWFVRQHQVSLRFRVSFRFRFRFVFFFVENAQPTNLTCGFACTVDKECLHVVSFTHKCRCPQCVRCVCSTYRYFMGWV